MSKYLGNELAYITKVLQGESWSATGGSWTHELEQAFAKKFGVKYAIAFNSGTSTLHAALLALGVKPGDEVIVPALGPIMTSAAVIHAGAIPVFADVEEHTFNIDPKDVEKKINVKTKAIIPVHLYGLPCDMDALLAFGIPIIEDCAQAVLSKYKGKLCGTMGKFGSFSFENSKHISCGEGGMLITDSEELALQARRIGGHGFFNLTAESGRVRLDPEIFQSPSYKRHVRIGYNYRLSEFQSAIALAQLEKVEELCKARRNAGLRLVDSAIDNMHVQPIEGHSYWAFATRYEGDWQKLRALFVEAGGHPFYGCWSLPYHEPGMSPYIWGEQFCPVAAHIQPQIMQFKTNFSVEDAKKQAKILKGVLS